MESSLISLELSFFPFFFSYVLFREASWKIPPDKDDTRVEKLESTHTLFLSLAFPDSRRFYFNDDLFYDSMTNDDYYSDMMRLTNGITNNRLDVEHDFFSKAYRALSFTLHSAR